jgi:hypothetical protein
MMRALGFLSGIGLTVAAFLLVLDNREHWRPESATEAGSDVTAEELAEVFEAIAEKVDVVPATPGPETALAPEPESAPTDSKTPSGFDLALLDPGQRPDVQAVAKQRELASAEADADRGVETSGPNPEQRLEIQGGSVQAIAPGTEFATAEGGARGGGEASGLDADQGIDSQAQAYGSDPADSGDAGMHLFWSPFRSEWSARGFARRLTSATQVPVEVVSAGPGRYRVAFSYQDETERLAHIERIETITGLSLE